MLARTLQISKAEVIRRALMLFKHAANAKAVKLEAEDGTERVVLIK